MHAHHPSTQETVVWNKYDACNNIWYCYQCSIMNPNFLFKKKTPLIKKVSSVDEKKPQNLLSEVIGKGIWGMQIIAFLWSYLMITPSELSSIAEPREGASKPLPLQTESVFDYNFQLYIYMSWLISAFLIKSKASREKNCLIHYYSGMVVWRRVSAVSMF